MLKAEKLKSRPRTTDHKSADFIRQDLQGFKNLKQSIPLILSNLLTEFTKRARAAREADCFPCRKSSRRFLYKRKRRERRADALKPKHQSPNPKESSSFKHQFCKRQQSSALEPLVVWSGPFCKKTPRRRGEGKKAEIPVRNRSKIRFFYWLTNDTSSG
jgi:hypothetical protein